MCEVARHELALAAPSLGADQVHQCAALAGAPGGEVEQRENRCDATPSLALVEKLCKTMRGRWDLVVVTNDIYIKEDQRLLMVAGALDAERIVRVVTGGDNLAPYVGADLAVMETDTQRMRPLHASTRPYVMTNLQTNAGLDRVVHTIETRGLLTA